MKEYIEHRKKYISESVEKGYLETRNNMSKARNELMDTNTVRYCKIVKKCCPNNFYYCKFVGNKSILTVGVYSDYVFINAYMHYEFQQEGEITEEQFNAVYQKAQNTIQHAFGMDSDKQKKQEGS